VKYQEVELLVHIGEYKRGADKQIDEPSDHIEAVNSFLCQGLHKYDNFKATVDKREQAVGM
jgi:type III secretion protein N (ATPase)